MNLILDPAKADTLLPRIIRAAVKLFVEKGIDGATVRDIAAAARVSEGALYRHFKSKNELAWHIFAGHLNQFSLELQERISTAPKARDKIHAYVSACFEAFDQEKDLFTYLILSEHREFSRFPETHLHPGLVAQRLVAAGQERGDLKKMDVLLAAALLFGGVHRVVLTHLYGALPGALAPRAGETADVLWQGLKK